MIDNIRFNFEFKPDENWLNKLKEKIYLKKDWQNKSGKAYRGRLFLKEVDLKETVSTKLKRKKKIPYLLIEITFTGSGARVQVENSLRKWFYDGVMNREFNKQTFNECLILLSEKLFIPVQILMDSKVTKVEYGGNMNFSPAFRCFTTCINEHKNYEKKCIYGNETVEFKGDYKSIIFYDKITEETQNSEKFSAKNQKAINKRAICIRYEVKIKKVSGVPNAKKHMSYLKDIITNWNLIVDLWVEELDKIVFINDMNPKVYDYLNDAKIKPINQYLIYLGMEKIGLNNWQLILKDRTYVKTRKGLMDSHRAIYNFFKSMLDNELEGFAFVFKSRVKQKAEEFKL